MACNYLRKVKILALLEWYLTDGSAPSPPSTEAVQEETEAKHWEWWSFIGSLYPGTDSSLFTDMSASPNLSLRQCQDRYTFCAVQNLINK